MADAAVINSPEYWNERFAADWAVRGGSEQTAFFARLASEMLPDWFWRQTGEQNLSFLDMGCALGEALPIFSARLPSSEIVGVDVSDVAIGMAAARQPQFQFRTIQQDWSDAPRAGVVFCSNTLEHFADWQARLTRLSELAQNYLVLLVPFREQDRIDEHVVAFDFDTFPAQLPDGKRLAYFRLTDAANAAQSRWNGAQALAVYGKRTKARATGPAASSPYEGMDLRGLTIAKIGALMASAAKQPVVHGVLRATGQTPGATQALLDQVNREWEQRLSTADSDYLQKHTEIKAHYESMLRERDARLELCDQQMALRVELERTRAVSEYQGFELERERQQSAALRAILERMPDADLQARELAMVRQALALREAGAARHENEVERLRADVAAAKSGLLVALEERDIARKSVALPAQEVKIVEAAPSQQLEGEIGRLKDQLNGAERALEGAKNEGLRLEAELASTRLAMQELERIYADEDAQHQRTLSDLRSEKALHEDNATALHNHYEGHLVALNRRLAQLGAEIDAGMESLRTAWAADMNRAGKRMLAEQHYAREQERVVNMVLSSKSWALAMRLRRLYWAARGEWRPPMPTAPARTRISEDAADANFMGRWSELKDSLARLHEDANFAGVTPATPAANLPETQSAGSQTVLAKSPGMAIAMQVESLSNGGLERVVFDLCIGLQRRGETVIVIAVSNGGAIADELRSEGVRVFEINQDLAKYEAVLASERVSDVFMHHSYFGSELANRGGARIYDVVHNSYFWLRDEANLVRKVAERASRLIYVSSAVRRFHERFFAVDPAKGVVINNPAHPQGLILPSREQLLRLRSAGRETVFLNVAQAYPAKAQAAMVTAFARAHRRNGGMRLQIAGGLIRDDAVAALKRRIAEEDVGDVVELLGYCDRRSMSGLYARAHAFILPSIYEGYSVSAVEAASYNLPLIMTDVGGARELIENRGCGIVLPPPVADLTQPLPAEIDRIGLASENASTAALEAAFEDLHANRSVWIARALGAAFEIQSLGQAVEAYLGVRRAARDQR